MIPKEAVEASAEVLNRLASMEPGKELARAALEAAVPYMFAHLLTFADERDNALGAIRSHITTHELRKLLGVIDD